MYAQTIRRITRAADPPIPVQQKTQNRPSRLIDPPRRHQQQSNKMSACRHRDFPLITEAPSCSVFNMDRTGPSGAQQWHEAPNCSELGSEDIQSSLGLCAAYNVRRCAGASSDTSINGDRCPNWLYSTNTKRLAGRYCPSCTSQRSRTLWDGRPVGTGSATGSSGTSSVASW